ncbi:unnamed protein product [Cuscuta campestris]|uniref:Uncharacterized protein n=1 Tax=Cuscuta campestris TaxID=132261 RepID=A0A484LP50_9ASTE|nr:unnamed protein product [Cuscuta campestris]
MILQFLPLKEQARTSVVCKGWMALWSNYFSGSLSIDMELPSEMSLGEDQIPSWRSKFVRIMDRLLLEELKYPYLKEFKVIYVLNDPSIASNIDRWIDVVMSKQVETLDLNFLKPMCKPRWHYTFSLPEQCHCLKVVRLRFICVSGETLEQLLGRCPFLEELSVAGSRALAGLNVLHQALNRLEIHDYGLIERVTVVSAPNLASFKFSGEAGDTRALLLDVPCLTELFLGSSYASYALATENFPKVENDPLHRVFRDSTELSERRLKQLTLDLSHNGFWGQLFGNQERIEKLLANLTHLNLIVPVGSVFRDLYTPYNISELQKTACPAFHKFVPKLEWTEVCHMERFFSHALGTTEVTVKKWIFHNTNGGLFTITWRGDSDGPTSYLGYP